MICSREKCLGCYACSNICPKTCIDMKEDELGYVYPEIDSNRCIKCNLCIKVCPTNNEIKFNFPQKAYAMWSLNESDRLTSSSGGAASIFSQYIVENGGIVFGASINKYRVKHIGIENYEELYKLKGSKYVHSYIGEVFKKIKYELKRNRKVLFIGTPCQVDGLNNYLQKEYSNLTTIDIICHGVPSQKFLAEFVDNKINGRTFDRISFRDSDGFYFKIFNEKENLFKEHMRVNLYYRGFMDSLFYRENCYSCPYAKEKRVSDITIGDFWGLGKEKPFNHDVEKGVSVLLPNTMKGIDLIKENSLKMFIEEREVLEAISGNSQLNHPSHRHKKYYKFKQMYLKKGFVYAAQKCLKIDILKSRIRNIIS